MFKRSLRFLALSLAALLFLSPTAHAAEVDSGSVYCFSEFSQEELTGICLTGLPGNGAVYLDGRLLLPGDVLTQAQASRMTFVPASTEVDRSAQVTYLPIYQGRVGESQVLTIAIHGKENKAPVAEDSAMETYKNLSNTALLKATDPEGEAMTFTIVRQPRRGTLELKPDGSFVYTPKKNKVGVDSFTYTAADPAGNVSREATVTVTILKPTDAAQYSDTQGRSCAFAAEWMRHTGIFAGEQIGRLHCFSPDREVTRGEFVTMLVKALDIPVDEGLTYTGYTDEIPAWLQPYLAAAVRAGLTLGLDDPAVFAADKPITEAEAALLLQNALTAVPTWAPDSAKVLTRANAAQLLYQAHGQDTN